MKLVVGSVLAVLCKKRAAAQLEIQECETGKVAYKERVQSLRQQIKNLQQVLREAVAKGPVPFKLQEYDFRVKKLSELERAISILEMSDDDYVNVKAGDFISKLL